MNLAAKAQGARSCPALDDFLQAVKGAAADKQDVGGVDVDGLLLGVLAPALGRHACHRALQDFQQRLLHALAADVPGDGLVLRLPGNLIDFIDVDDAPFRLEDVVVRRLNQPQQDVLHVLAHVASLRQGGGVRNGEGHIQQLGQRLGQVRLANAGGAQQQHIALGDFHVVVGEVNALIVVVDRYGEGHFRVVLAHHVLVQLLFDLLGLWKEDAHLFLVAPTRL